MISGVPNVARLRAGCVGIAALDQLNAAGCALVDGRRDEQMNVVGHDGEGVQPEFAGVSITEDCFDKKPGVGFALEVPMLLEC